MDARLQKLKVLLRKQNPQTAGEDGEKYADKWLRNSKWLYVPVEQGRTTLSKKLRLYGGKRPDFIVENKHGNDIILVDAKYHKTKNGTTFWLTDDELDKYRALKSYAEQYHTEGDVWVLFMVFPKEYDGTTLLSGLIEARPAESLV